MRHEGDLVITKENANEFVGLASVGGWLYVAAEFNAPNLTSVGGELAVDVEFNAPNLTSVGGWLNVCAEFNAPNLTSVGGWLYVAAEFNAPNLTSVGGRLGVAAEFNAPNLASVGGWLYVAAEFNAPNLTSVEGEHITKFAYLLDLDWPVLVTDGYIRVGCQRHTKERWSSFTNAQIEKMHPAALEFWAKNKHTILGM